MPPPQPMYRLILFGREDVITGEGFSGNTNVALIIVQTCQLYSGLGTMNLLTSAGPFLQR
jgi:hypothetical protein